MSLRSLSIVIPTYNRSLILKESLKYYLKYFKDSDYSCYEIIVIDNSTNCETEKVIEEFKSSILRIKYFRNIVNIGGSPNILRGFEYSQNDYVWILPDDCYPSDTFLKSFKSIDNSQVELFFLGHINDKSLLCLDQEDLLTSTFISDSSWLPKIIYRRDAALKYLAGSYNVLNYSYPHLFLIYNIIKFKSDENLSFISSAFSTIDIEKSKFQSYSWIKGSAIKFAQSINLFVSEKSVRRGIIRSHKASSNLNFEVFRLVFWEFSFLKLTDFLLLIKFYGYFHIVTLLQYLFFCVLGYRLRIKVYFWIKLLGNNGTQGFYKFYRGYLQRMKNSRPIF